MVILHLAQAVIRDMPAQVTRLLAAELATKQTDVIPTIAAQIAQRRKTLALIILTRLQIYRLMQQVLILAQRNAPERAPLNIKLGVATPDTQ